MLLYSAHSNIYTAYIYPLQLKTEDYRKEVGGKIVSLIADWILTPWISVSDCLHDRCYLLTVQDDRRMTRANVIDR